MSKLCLIVIDGFGVAPPGPGNARTLAKMPIVNSLEKSVPNVLMDASGNAVGLPEGQQGASEPGHLTIGAGRIVWQPLEEINRAIRLGDFEKNRVLLDACKRSRERNVPLHLIGMYSQGGVHSHTSHFHALLAMAKKENVPAVFFHLFADGRDVPEQSIGMDLELLKKEIDSQKAGVISSLVGRYFAMDRDKQYADRTKVAYDLLTAGEGKISGDFAEGAKAWYAEATDKQKTDYYIRPLRSPDFAAIKADDVCIAVNFRSDRMIQIVQALADDHFLEFARPVQVKDVVCMGPYSPHLPIAFPPADVSHTLGQVVSDAGLKQLRIAETDKFAHVTFFFNAQQQEPYEGEERVLIESPKVPNFAETPRMSADALTEELIKRAETGEYGFIVANFANPDLVGHGGKPDAVVTACETVDENLARLLPALEKAGYDWIITADHGNAEQMYYPGTETVCPSHTTNRVQTFVKSAAIASAEDLKAYTGLKDIAPLCLKILGIPIPKEMQSR